MTAARAKTTARSPHSQAVARPAARSGAHDARGGRDGRNAGDDAALSAGALRDGVAALGLALTDAQLAQLQRFATLLLRWNRVHNLTALAQPGQVLSHHLLDSLAIVAPLRGVAADIVAEGRAPRVLDVGAGGGLPGIPLAIALPEWRFTLLDKVAKKTAFLTQAALELSLGNVEVATARVEAWGRHAPPFDIVVARAYASLAELVRSTHALLAADGRWCAMKGTVPLEEIAELDGAALPARVVSTIKLQVPRLDAERHLIVLGGQVLPFAGAGK